MISEMPLYGYNGSVALTLNSEAAQFTVLHWMVVTWSITSSKYVEDEQTVAESGDPDMLTYLRCSITYMHLRCTQRARTCPTVGFYEVFPTHLKQVARHTMGSVNVLACHWTICWLYYLTCVCVGCGLYYYCRWYTYAT